MQESYFIYVNGVRIPVSEEVYHDIKRAEWREEKQKAVRGDREVSFDALLEDGVTLPANEKLVEGNCRGQGDVDLAQCSTGRTAGR